MFDPETALLLRSAPAIEGLDPKDIPQLLTSAYANIVSMRLGGEEQYFGDKKWSLERIADTYELIVSVNNSPEIRRSSAFVAASAQQVIARRDKLEETKASSRPNISRERLDPTVSAVLLFLIAEQYADAKEASDNIEIPNFFGVYEADILACHVVDLATGNMKGIIDRANERLAKSQPDNLDLESLALSALLERLAFGIELVATEAIGYKNDFDETNDLQSPLQIFESVEKLCSSDYELSGVVKIEYIYPGVRHLANLLSAFYRSISNSMLVNTPAPPGANSEFWDTWIKFRANKFPYVWTNHRKALEQGFHLRGSSAVLVLPTGAGKTTVSSIKIAGVLSQGKKVVFLAPTHALVEQLTSDLQEMFPTEILGSTVSSDFDLLFRSESELPEIEVMTPERCLAMLSFSAESFDEVGLLVFDECHLLSPESGKIRRALDGMLCILAFQKLVPEADMLFLSAMINNSQEFAQWIGNITERECLSIDLLWKPSRQARGVVIYEEGDLQKVKTNALGIQAKLDREKGEPAKDLRVAALASLNIQPYAIWGLQHNWLDHNKQRAACSFTKLIDGQVNLHGVKKANGLVFKPNANAVAAKIAEVSARSGLKTIVFVNQKLHAISTANEISKYLGGQVVATENEQLRWDALEKELGGLDHSILEGPSLAVPHNASMLRLERGLSESMYKRSDGAQVIVATPTLAQGLNLPAQLAILAGDKRAVDGGREDLQAHELLNAAARAGRAGHLANGIVLLVPEPVLSFPRSKKLSNRVVNKLQSILPEDDRCVEINDPLQLVLDKISRGDSDRDVDYILNRLSILNDADQEESGGNLFNLRRSFAAYKASQSGDKKSFDEKLKTLEQLLDDVSNDDAGLTVKILASQSGLPTEILGELKNLIEGQIGHLPETIEGWVKWLLDYLKGSAESRYELLFDVREPILSAVGQKKTDELTAESIDRLVPGIVSWLQGEQLKNIELALGGDPASKTKSKKICPRARTLISTIIPRSLSFIMGLITKIVHEVNPYGVQESLSSSVVESLSPALRLGYDSPAKLAFSFENPNILSRVGVHEEFAKTSID